MLKIGLYGLHRGAGIDPDTLVHRAQLAERAGFESLWVGDHIAMPADSDGAQLRLEAVVTISHLAAVTNRVRLGFGVLVLPQRQPVLLAKQLTSLDVLSGGRLIVGIGAGYVEPEMHAMGVSLAERKARTDEHLAVMHTLWREPHPSFDGRFVSFSDVLQRPFPRQRPHPPVVVGGHSPAAMRRAVRTAHGWYGVYLDVPEAAEMLHRLRAVVAEGGRPPELDELEITVTPPGPVDAATARRYADLGVHRLVVQPATDDGPHMEELIDTVGATIVGTV